MHLNRIFYHSALSTNALTLFTASPMAPTVDPMGTPTAGSTASSTSDRTRSPTAAPTESPTADPMGFPTTHPTAMRTVFPAIALTLSTDALTWSTAGPVDTIGKVAPTAGRQHDQQLAPWFQKVVPTAGPAAPQYLQYHLDK